MTTSSSSSVQSLPYNAVCFDRNDLLRLYFRMGFKYAEMAAFMEKYHGIQLSVRQIKRLLKSLALSRRTLKSDLVSVMDTIQHEIVENSASQGYRSMHSKLTKQYGLVVDRETVRACLSEIDPIGVARRQHRRLRRRRYDGRGPNYIWHIDGWDKLKQFGLCIHGCADGFSRRLIWLHCSPTNNDPYLIGHYFANAIERVGGAPRIVRCDRGTENVNVERIQTVLRYDDADTQATFGITVLYGRSTANQRIEAFWSKIKQLGLSSWTEHFCELRDNGLIDTSDKLHIECIRFCYMHLLRDELLNVRLYWNTHTIRRSTAVELDGGKPDILFHFPEAFGSNDYKTAVDINDLSYLRQTLTYDISDSECEFASVFNMLLLQHGKSMPTTLTEAADLYAFLVDNIEAELI